MVVYEFKSKEFNYEKHEHWERKAKDDEQNKKDREDKHPKLVKREARKSDK